MRCLNWKTMDWLFKLLLHRSHNCAYTGLLQSTDVSGSVFAKPHQLLVGIYTNRTLLLPRGSIGLVWFFLWRTIPKKRLYNYATYMLHSVVNNHSTAEKHREPFIIGKKYFWEIDSKVWFIRIWSCLGPAVWRRHFPDRINRAVVMLSNVEYWTLIVPWLPWGIIEEKIRECAAIRISWNLLLNLQPIMVKFPRPE